MKRILFSLLVIFFLSRTVVSGQINAKDVSQVLQNLYSRLVNNYDDSSRVQINDSIELIIGGYVRSDTVLAHRFNNLKYLGQITSPDSLLKIVTWNLVLRNRPSFYFCYIIRKPPEGGKNLVYRLISSYKTERVRTDTIYSELNWYGSLYYDIRPIVRENKRWWVLLGIDYGNPFISRKIIEVLSFTPEGSVLFGKKWFVSGEETRFRDVFEYASNGMMSLRFSSEISIVFDHLVPFSQDLKDDRQYYGPDYSYDAYYFENGLWKLTINVDARNKE